MQMIIKAFEMGKSLKVDDALAALRKYYPVISTDPLTLALSAKRGQYLLLTKYGVVALIGWSASLEQKAINLLSPFISGSDSNAEYFDDIKVMVDEKSQIKVLFDKILIPRFDEKFILIIGSLLTQSVGLESYETRIDVLLNNLNKELEILKKPKFFIRAKDFTAPIIKMINLRQEIVANIGILDKPDLIWDNPELNSLYASFSKELELKERTKILAEKIDFLKDSMKTCLEMLNAQRGFVLEFAIVALIALDIILILLMK